MGDSRKKIKLAFLLTATAAVVACRQMDSSSPSISVTVPTIQLHESSVALNTNWALSKEPLIDIGIHTGLAAYEFHRVKSAKKMSDGRIVVANSGSSELRLYNALGRFERAIGRPGSGPGEFRYLAWVQVLAGDTIVAVDPGLRRLTAFTATGRLAWTRAFDAGLGSWMAELSPGDVLLENGGLVVSWDTGDVWQKIEKGIVKIGQVTRSSAAVLLFSATGALMDTVAILPGMEHAVIAGSSGKPATTFPYMGRTLSVAVGKGKIVLGSAERYDIREYGSAGQLVRVFQDRNADLSVTDADVGRFQQPMINRVGSDPGARRTMQNMLTQQPRPDTKPAYGRFLIDKVGNVWIADAHSLLEAPRRWIAVDEAGAIIARLDLPDRYDLYEIGTDYVLGRWIDSSGVEHVRLFGLTKEMQ